MRTPITLHQCIEMTSGTAMLINERRLPAICQLKKLPVVLNTIDRVRRVINN